MKEGLRKIILVIAGITIVGVIWYLEAQKPKVITPQETEIISPRVNSIAKEEKSKRYPAAKEITNPSGFVNADNISLADLIGKKVILLDFWTYSCINCQRTFPYIKSWWEKYKDKGLVIIGIHTPEFAFEKEYENVRRAVERFGIRYPVVLDNDHGTWDAYQNRYWPRKYLIDIDGFVVYDHIGEGGYEETEKKIQETLEERMRVLGIQDQFDKNIVKPADVPDIDFAQVESPETYFGAARNVYLGNGKSQVRGAQTLREPDEIKKNTLYVVGDWQFEDEFAENKSHKAKIIFRYHAKDVYLVMSSKSGVKIKILKDGKPPVESEGSDVAPNSGEGFVKEDRLYKLIHDADYGEHTLEIIIEDPGVRVFAFTFG